MWYPDSIAVNSCKGMIASKSVERRAGLPKASKGTVLPENGVDVKENDVSEIQVRVIGRELNFEGSEFN